MAGKQSVSFSFTKKQDKKLTNTQFDDEQTDFITSVEGNEINSTIPKEKKRQLIIPLILRNNLTHVMKSQKNDTDDSLDAKAAREIIQECMEMSGKIETKTSNNESLSIPMYLQNKLDKNEKLDLSEYADVAETDYDQVPVEEFGYAMLRGMGWKPGDSIGKTNKANIKPIEPNYRPKGLGLGADVNAAKNKAKEQLDKENESLIVGSHVQIQSGSHKGLYGKLIKVDADTARFDVQLAIGGETVSVLEYFLKWISKSEYKEKSKVINNEKYERLKAKHEEKSKHRKSRSRSKSPGKKIKKRKDKYESNESDDSDDDSDSSSKIWVRPFLRVRFIDKKFKNGKYFNTKLVVDDVADINSCSCRMEDGRYLDGIWQNWLETIVPRHKGAFVMVISGKYNGQLGEILDRDKSKCIATVQLLRERLIVKLEYDFICEYVGDVTKAQDY